MKCVQCGKEFDAARSTAQYCSGACKKQYQRSGTSLSGTSLSGTDPDETAPVPLDQIPGLSIPTPTNQGPDVECRPGMRQLTDDDIAALPAAVVRPLCRKWAPIDCGDEQLQGMIPSHDWQSSPEYAERIYRLLRRKTTWSLSAWVR